MNINLYYLLHISQFDLWTTAFGSKYLEKFYSSFQTFFFFQYELNLFYFPQKDTHILTNIGTVPTWPEAVLHKILISFTQFSETNYFRTIVYYISTCYQEDL